MANTYAILSELIRSNSEVATFQKDKLIELSTKDFPFLDSQLLIEALKKINTEIIKKFEEFNQRYIQLENEVTQAKILPNDVSFQDLRDDLLTFIKFVWNVNTFVYFVEQSAREHISQSTMYLISNLTKQYEADSSFFLTPIQEQNFVYRDLGKYIKELIIDAIPNAEDILQKLPDNFSILSFPEIYRDNIVANILLAHEVGHFIVNVESLERQVNPKVKIDIEEFNKFTSSVAATPIGGANMQSKISDFFKIERLQAEYWESLTVSIQSWIRELLSDMIGFKLAGPVFIIALSEMLLSMFQHGMASDRYPPTSYRLQLLLEELDSQKFIDSVVFEDQEKIREIINEIKEYVKTPSVSINDPILNMVYKAVDSVKTLITTTAHEVTKDMQYKPVSFGNDIPNLLKKLENLTPPCEIKDGEPANIISILNAGMIYKMTWMHGNKYASSKREDIEETERTINALVLRSIEMSVMHQNMLDNFPKKKVMNSE